MSSKPNDGKTGKKRSTGGDAPKKRSASASKSTKSTKPLKSKGARAIEPDEETKVRKRKTTSADSVESAEVDTTTEKRVLTQEERSVRNEIILTVTALVSVLITLTFFDLGGPVGAFVNQVLFGTLGALAFIFPLLLFFFMAFYLSNHGNKVASRKMAAGFAFLFLLTALLQMIFGLHEELGLLDYYKYCATNKNGGGLFGAFIAVPFTKAFGTVATYCIIIAFMMIFLIILTGKALFSLITRKSRETIKETREKFSKNSEYYKELAEEEFEREERNRMLYVNLNGESNVVEKPKPKPSKTGLIDSWLHNGEKKEFEGTENVKKVEDQGEQDIDEIFAPDKMFRPAKPIEVTPASAVADPFPYTITGAVDDTPQEPVPTDMKEITPKRRSGAKAKPDEVIRGYADNAEKPAEAQEIKDVNAQKTAGTEPEKVKSDPKINAETAAQIEANMAGADLPKKYVFPPVTLLNESKNKNGSVSKREVEKNADALIGTLESFGVRVKLLNVSCGPTVTRYELAPEHGVKVSSITKLENDIKLNLAAADIRIEAPIPGKAAIGIEVPNKENSTVSIRELIESNEFKKQEKGITFAVGKDISGECIVTDISKMPHLLIAGATGSGKSVCINTLIMSILYKFKPEDIRLIMIDPKMVELGVYNGIPHLLIPVVTDPKKAAASLNWAVLEMTNRYEKFAEAHVRDLKGYNAYIETEKKKPENKAEVDSNPEKFAKMPQIVIIVDELADLMMVAPGEVENAIIRLSQLARAAGMHLVIATQRPSVNVITGLIKANMPSRIALAVTSNVDSRTILDQGGAEKLLGKGDMLFAPMNLPKPIRVQGAFVSDGEVEKVVTFIKEENAIAEYNDEVTTKINSMNISGGKTSAPIDTSEASTGSDEDEYLVEAARLIIEKQKASIGMLQRVYRIGFNRAARIVDTLTDMGVLGPENGTKSREILMTKEQFDEFIQNKGE